MLLVGRRKLPGGFGRGLAIVASIGLSAVVLHAQNSPAPAPAAVHTADAGAPAPVAEPPPSPPPVITPPTLAGPEETAALVANVSAAPGEGVSLALPAGVGTESGLQIKTIWAERVISVLFPEIKTIYGFRQDALRWHPSGLAIDVMIPNYHSPEGIALGDQIAGYALANAKRWGISHVIWRQKIYQGTDGGSWTSDLGNETANHYDHVHIATDGGGYPTGHETYYIGSVVQSSE